MLTKITLGLLALTLAISTALAQSPVPIVVQAVVPGVPAAAAARPAAGAPAATSDVALKTLLELKAANEEIIRKQAATLLQLEEMEKAADQIKIYTKRG